MRRGIALVLVICLVLVLAVFGGILRLLTHGAAVEVDVVTAQLRAIAVGELAFGAVSARLSATAWRDRWFRTAAEVVSDVPAGGGSYTYVLRDAPRAADAADPLAGASATGLNQADLLVRATQGRTSVLMFWRLTVPEDSLDALVTVVPTYFGFPADDTPVSEAGVDALGPLITDTLRARERNAPRAGSLAGPLGRATGPAEAGRLLGSDPGRVVEGVEPPGGGPVLPRAPPEPTPVGLPVPRTAAPRLEGVWTSAYQDLRINATDPRRRHARDYVEMREGPGGAVAGHAQFIDDDGELLTEWDFTTVRDGARLRFDLQNVRTVITGPDAPGNSISLDLRQDAGGNVMTGEYVQPGFISPARYERVP